MALQLAKELESGLQAEYWKITKIILVGESSCACVVELFKDGAARLANKASVQRLEYSWAEEENPCSYAALEVSNPMVLCYNKLKSRPEFAGAQDA